MFITPAPGRLVRDPITRQHIPESGADVPESPYWLRRLAAGDVVAAAAPAPPSPTSPTRAKE